MTQATRPPSLEIRLAEHAPNYIHLKNGQRMEEPPEIEGYLERIRPNTQTKQQTYLTTHHGYLFTLNSHTFPPMPPGLAPTSSIYSDAQALRHSEVRRGTNQVMNATGVMDLRSIMAVRRAFQASPIHVHDQKETHDDENSFGIWSNLDEQAPEDEEDLGGDSGLTKSVDRTRTKVRRSFELLLNSGRVVRFEVSNTSRFALSKI